jgi:AcrR family transcriptional regulator
MPVCDTQMYSMDTSIIKIHRNKVSSTNKNLRRVSLKSLSARERILKIAILNFNAHGVHTTGIDKIIADSKVAKMTFYKHFQSKKDLILAYLEAQDKKRFNNIKKIAIDKHTDPTKQMLAVFDALEIWFNEPDFTGCPFVKGLADFSEDKKSPAYKKVLEHFDKHSRFFEERLLQIMRPAKVKTILPQILSLMIGSIIIAVATKDSHVAQINKKRVEQILIEA